MTSFLLWRGRSDLDKILQIGAEWHVDCGDMVKIETRCRIPIWRTFGRISWHVQSCFGYWSPELEPVLPSGEASTWWVTWWVMSSQSHLSHCRVLPLGEFTVVIAELCHISGCSHLAKSMSWSCHIAGCNNSICHIENRFSPYFIYLFVF